MFSSSYFSSTIFTCILLFSLFAAVLFAFFFSLLSYAFPLSPHSFSTYALLFCLFSSRLSFSSYTISFSLLFFHLFSSRSHITLFVSLVFALFSFPPFYLLSSRVISAFSSSYLLALSLLVFSISSYFTFLPLS